MLELIGRYRIHEQIGEGAMADVYRAHDPHIHRPLAIKVLKHEYREDREYAARFLREARAAGALSHPSIVTVFDVGEVDGYPFIVMELLEGEPLSEILKRGPIPASQVIGTGMQLADALAYAHGQGVIHRDVKPSNIILSPDGRTLKLLDFGIAQLAEHDPLFEEASYRTQVGQVLGTPRYMSPEQTMGHEMDGRSDVYSVGVVLYEMLAGRRAFPGTTAATLATQILNSDPPALADVAPNTPRGLQFIVHKAMAKQPAQRFADAARLSEALRREYSVAETIAKEAAAQRQYVPLQVRLTLMLATITAVVLAIAVGTVLVKQREAMRQVAVSSGAAVSAFVANNAALRAVENAALPVEEQDWVPVQAFVKNAAADPNLRGLTVVDASGIVRAATDPNRIGQPYQSVGGEPLVANRDGVTIRSANDGGSFRFVRPITYAGHGFGKVDLLLDQGTLHAAGRLATAMLVLLAFITLGTVALVTFLSARLLQAPIGRLRGALFELARGNLDFRVSHSRSDEFGDLFDDVNLVAQTMQERLDAVEAMVLDRPAKPVAIPAQDLDAKAASTPVAPIEGVEPIAPVDPIFAPPLIEDEQPLERSPGVEASTDAPLEEPAEPEPDRAVEARVERAPDIEPAAVEPVAEPVAVEPAPVEPAVVEPTPVTEDTRYLAPPWPHDADEDRTLVDPQDERFH